MNIKNKNYKTTKVHPLRKLQSFANDLPAFLSRQLVDKEKIATEKRILGDMYTFL